MLLVQRAKAGGRAIIRLEAIIITRQARRYNTVSFSGISRQINPSAFGMVATIRTALMWKAPAHRQVWQQTR